MTRPRVPLEPGRIVGVVDIGATAIRIVVAEIGPNGTWRRLDRAGKPISLGRDVFTTGYLSAESMRQSIKILSGFRELLDGWGITTSDVRVIATSAVREAKNRDMFIDRVFVRTGFRTVVVEGVEENHLTYLAVQHALAPKRQEFLKTGSLIIEVGGGSTELMLLNRGQMVAAHSLRIGTVRMEQQVRPGWDTGLQIEEYLKENIRVTRELLDAEMKLDRVKFFVAVGGDARIAAATVGRKTGDAYSEIAADDFRAFVAGLMQCSIEETVHELGVTYYEAEGLLPALIVYRGFLEATSADTLIVPDVSIREGVLATFALGTEENVVRQFYDQVIASARSLGRRYHYDERHALHVRELAVQIFDGMKEDHGMDVHCRLLIEAAAILHDIGYFIRSAGHHKHGQYIIENSEIFGVSRTDVRIISNVVRYHRRSAPMPTHPSFSSLRREHRMIVMKLAAILRVADALDRGHIQRVSSVSLERNEDDVMFHCTHTGDISVEKNGVAVKGGMFEDVFGYRVVIL